jgi:hypothetical protein
MSHECNKSQYIPIRGTASEVGGMVSATRRRKTIKDNKKFKVSKLTLPAKAQWEALIKHPIKDCDDNLTTLEDCFDKPEFLLNKCVCK